MRATCCTLRWGSVAPATTFILCTRPSTTICASPQRLKRSYSHLYRHPHISMALYRRSTHSCSLKLRPQRRPCQPTGPRALASAPSHTIYHSTLTAYFMSLLYHIFHKFLFLIMKHTHSCPTRMNMRLSHCHPSGHDQLGLVHSQRLHSTNTAPRLVSNLRTKRIALC